MLYVVVEELIPEASNGQHSNLSTVGFAVGFVIMMVLDCKPQLIGNTVSNPVTFTGYLPTDRDSLIHDFLTAKAALSEENLEKYRKNIKSL